jgi:hypothetical protein
LCVVTRGILIIHFVVPAKQFNSSQRLYTTDDVAGHTFAADINCGEIAATFGADINCGEIAATFGADINCGEIAATFGAGINCGEIDVDDLGSDIRLKQIDTINCNYK